MNIEQKQQYLNHLQGLIAEQDLAIANGTKYINKSWRMFTKLTIKQLTTSIARG